MQAIPPQMAVEITTAEVDEWVVRLFLTPVTRNTFRRDFRTLFSFLHRLRLSHVELDSSLLPAMRSCRASRELQRTNRDEIDLESSLIEVIDLRRT